MVMATGIVSIACQLLGLRTVAVALLAINGGLYVTLWILTIARMVRYPARVLADVSHHGRAVGFFTIVAATSVVGSETLLVAGEWRIATALWTAGIALWAAVTYTVFTALTVGIKGDTGLR